jgi:hypothetical protein
MNNPFYMGVIRIKKTGETFEGKHTALIKPGLFYTCQDILQGRTNTRTKKHRLMYRRLFICLECNRTLIGEVHGRFVYYRCQNPECLMTTIREELLEQGFLAELDGIRLADRETDFFYDKVRDLKANWINERLTTISLLEGKVQALKQRLGKLTDAFIDSTIDKDIYEERKAAILIERKSLEGKIAELNNGRSIPDEIQEFLEFTKDPKTLYETAFPDKKRTLVQLVTSKNLANKKSLVFGFKAPFDIMRDREKIQYGSPSSDVHRKLEELWLKVVDAFRRFEWPEI